jgi:hypothetical protein
MIGMNVFEQDAFSAVNLTAGIDKSGYVPTLLGSIPGLFGPPPMGQPRSKDIFTEERIDAPALIQTSPRGAEPSDGREDETTRKVRPFSTTRIARRRRIMSTEVAGIRAFGMVDLTNTVELITARTQRLMQRDFSLTWEFYRLGVVTQAIMSDAPAAAETTIYNWATAFGQSVPGAATWNLPNVNSANNGEVAGYCSTARRSIIRGLRGLGGDGVTVHALCGDAFYDALRACAEVRETFKYSDGADLRLQRSWTQFDYGGVRFYNYRGTDDNSTVAVNVDDAFFFPAGAGIFQEVYAPADERIEFIGTPGQEAYAWIVRDEKRDMWVDVEMYSYPLFMCTMPQALYSATLGTVG